jgi:proteasome assembly chaperone 2
MQFTPTTSASGSSFANATVIFPCVTHGNVGQLAADLLIFNLKLKSIGVLYHPDVLPVCGADPFSETNEGTPASSLEIYANEDASLVVAQQRGEIIKGCQRKFAREVTSWLKTKACKKVLLLASLPSTVGEKDSQIGGTKWRTIQTPNVITESYPKVEGEGECSSISGESSISRNQIPALEFEQIPEDLKNRRIPPWTFVYECIKQKLTAQFLVALCSEGDNSVDADRMASHTLAMIDIVGVLNTGDIVMPTNELRWATPPSWKRVYGTSMNRSVFA